MVKKSEKKESMKYIQVTVSESDWWALMGESIKEQKLLKDYINDLILKRIKSQDNQK